MNKGFEKPENCCTVWELYRDYGISKQKTCSAIRKGKLNGFMLGDKAGIVRKWYIECDELLVQYLDGVEKRPIPDGLLWKKTLN